MLVAVDSAHAADLWFTYKVRNTGTEYAREIANLAFQHLYWRRPRIRPTPTLLRRISAAIGKFVNFKPDEEHTYTSRRIPLSLEQMKTIDLGGPIRVVVEDFSYGATSSSTSVQLNAGVLVAIEDGSTTAMKQLTPT